MKGDIRAERGKVYGDPQEMHGNIARVWTAQLRARYGPGAPELDANMAELLLAGFKVLRASRPVPDEPSALASYMDSYPDAENYLDFAREAVEGNPMRALLASIACKDYGCGDGWHAGSCPQNRL